MMEQENEDESEFDRKAINTFATQNIGKIRLLLENVLIWAKTQMQGISIDPTVINVKAFLDDVCDIINLTATNKSIQLKLEVSESAEFYAA
jgi:signal transduction histidine kinase